MLKTISDEVMNKFFSLISKRYPEQLFCHPKISRAEFWSEWVSIETECGCSVRQDEVCAWKVAQNLKA